MRARDGGVHRQRPVHHAGRVRRGGEFREHPIPGLVERHPAMPRPYRLPRPEHLRQIPPRDPAPIPVDDRLDHQSRVREPPSGPARRTGQQIFDQRPLSIREHLKPRHQTRLSARRLNLCQTRPRPLAFRLNESTRAQLDIIAGLNDRTVTDEVRLAVESWIEKIKSDPTVQRRAEEVRADIERKAATKGSAAISGIPSAVRASPAMLAYFFLPPLTADNWVVPLLSMFGFGVLAGIPAALVDQLVEKWVKARRSGSAAPQR